MRRYGKMPAWIAISVVGLAMLMPAGRAMAQASAGSPSGEQSQQGETIEGELAKEESAAEHGGGHGTEALKHSSSVKLLAKVTGLNVESAYWLAVMLNLAIVVGVVVYFARKSLPGLFQNRTASIQKAMEEARKASADANRRLSEIESRLAKLDVEIGTMQASAEKEVEAEERRIAEATQDEARKIVEMAEQEIAAAVKVGRRDLKAYAADLAVTLAAKQIKVDAKTDQSLVEKFAQDLASQGSGGRKDN